MSPGATSPEPTTVAHRFTDAFHTRDVEKIVEVFHPEVVYHDLFYGAHRGHEGIRGLFRRMFAEGSRHEWTMTAVVAAPEVTVGEWRFAFTVADTVPQGSGRTLRFPGVSVFETRGHRCHLYREYFDRTAALLAVGIAPAAVARIVARRPTVDVTVPGADTVRP